MQYQGQTYGLNTTFGSNPQQEIDGDFCGLISGAYKRNGIVFACILTRMLLFSEARYQFARMNNGRRGELFGTPELAVLEDPWPNGTTSDLNMRALQDIDLAGNFFAYRDNSGPVPRIRRLRPDWVTIVAGSQLDSVHPMWQADAEVAGYLYHPGGRRRNEVPLVFLPEEIAHWALLPDPDASWRGMSWIVPVVREIMGDQAATDHKLRFFENGATPNLVVSLDPNLDKEAYDMWVEAFRENTEGAERAYKTLYLGGGSTAEVVGAHLRQIDFKTVQGAGETRIAAAAGVPPIIVGLSEGLEASTYSNYDQARRRLADGTMRPTWRSFASSLKPLVNVPAGAELWYDERDIAWLREDRQAIATIMKTQAETITTLINGGYTPESIVQAVLNADAGLLVHSGLVSVQLQAPGTVPGQPPTLPSPSAASLPRPTHPALPAGKGRDTLLLLDRIAGQSRPATVPGGE